MEPRISKAKMIGVIAFLVILGIILLLTFNVFSYKKEKEQEIKQKIKYVEKDVKMSYEGSYLEYISLGDPYVEKGITATTKDGRDISEQVLISYFKNGSQVPNLETDELGSYLVRYTVTDEKFDHSFSVDRAIIVVDNKAPIMSFPEKTEITSTEAASYDLHDGVVVTDNSGEFSLSYDNTLSTLTGEYIITYKATDISGNETTRKRLIKVTSGIEFDYADGYITIDYPNGNYEYQYSLDCGITWNEAFQKQTIEFSDAVIIARVCTDDNYVMSNSFSTKKEDF